MQALINETFASAAGTCREVQIAACGCILLLAEILDGSAVALAKETTQAPVQKEYARCHDVLWSAPADTLSTYVSEGYGARLSSGNLEDVVRSLRCSDAQIVEYMKHHGLPHSETIERVDIVETGDGSYNRVLHFCIPNRGWFTRTLRGDCGGATSFWMLNDRVQWVSSHGFKRS